MQSTGLLEGRKTGSPLCQKTASEAVEKGTQNSGDPAWQSCSLHLSPTPQSLLILSLLQHLVSNLVTIASLVDTQCYVGPAPSGLVSLEQGCWTGAVGSPFWLEGSTT